MVLDFAFALVALAGLSFLGLGIEPGAADWGRMLAENKNLLFTNPWAAVVPAVLHHPDRLGLEPGRRLDVRLVQSMSDAAPLLEVEDLGVSSNGRTITTGDQTSPWVPARPSGSLASLGAGKSMTARAIVRLLPQGVFASGRVVFGGRDLLSLSERQMAAVRGNGGSR